MSGIKNYHGSVSDWRKVLRVNRRRSSIVIALFFLIYIGVGFLCDIVMQINTLTDAQAHQATLHYLTIQLLTFKFVPTVTLLALGVAAISLLVTIYFHESIMLLGTRYRVVTSDSTNFKLRQLYDVVEEMKVAAGLAFMPKVVVIDAAYMNAFASGYGEKSAMITVTRGLLEKLDRDELTAVVAHELSHIRHLDIRVILTASVMANLVLILLDVFRHVLFFTGKRGKSKMGTAGIPIFVGLVVLRFTLPLLTILMMLFLGRSREYMADAGCVELMRNNEPLARALLKIQGDHQDNRQAYGRLYRGTANENVRRQAYIFDPIKAKIETKRSFSDLFSTHPGVNKRLKALGFKKQA